MAQEWSPQPADLEARARLDAESLKARDDAAAATEKAIQLTATARASKTAEAFNAAIEAHTRASRLHAAAVETNSAVGNSLMIRSHKQAGAWHGRIGLMLQEERGRLEP